MITIAYSINLARAVGVTKINVMLVRSTVVVMKFEGFKPVSIRNGDRGRKDVRMPALIEVNNQRFSSLFTS